jgi:hypothetical protein
MANCEWCNAEIDIRWAVWIPEVPFCSGACAKSWSAAPREVVERVDLPEEEK